jgi:hypothetical protein
MLLSGRGLSNPILPDRSAHGDDAPYRGAVSFNPGNRFNPKGKRSSEAAGGILIDAAEALGDALPDRLQRLVAGGVQRGVDADALGRAVIDGDEDGGLAVFEGVGGRHVVPHMVSMVFGMLVPSWLRGPRARPGRNAAWRPFSRTRQRTRPSMCGAQHDVRIPGSSGQRLR